MTDGPLLEVGRTARAHGVRGDVYVDLHSDRPERVAPGARLEVGGTWMVVAASRPAGTRWLVRFEGIADRNAAEVIANRPLRAHFVDVERPEGEFWVHELVGARVVDQHGVDRGECVAVVANPAHDLLELADGQLVPVVFVTSCADGLIRVDAPDGLFDDAK